MMGGCYGPVACRYLNDVVTPHARKMQSFLSGPKGHISVRGASCI